jgi:hypothetical protein
MRNLGGVGGVGGVGGAPQAVIGAAAQQISRTMVS